MQKTPTLVDLRQHCPSPYDQGALGCSTAHAIAAAIRFGLAKDGQPPFLPSRLFIYYHQRLLMAQDLRVSPDALGDSGGSVRDGFKSVVRFKVCDENLWPYDPANLNKKPSFDCYRQASRLSSFLYASLENSLQELRYCLSEGVPFVFGFPVFTGLMGESVAKDGLLPMPKPNEIPLGSHAALAVGYDDESRCILVQNSWGMGWGQAGYFFMPYDYLLTFGSDIWTIKHVLFAQT